MKNIELKVKGHIDRSWSEWFGGFEITHIGDGASTLSGSVRDQAELRGVLYRLTDLNLELMSVNTLPSCVTEKPVKEGG
jgi:hypothetical protein